MSEPELPPALSALVVEGLTAYRARRRIGAIVLGVLGLALMASMVAEGGAMGFVVGLIALAPGGLLFVSSLGDPAKSGAVRSLARRRADIVWIFEDPNVRLGRVVVGLADKSTITLYVPRGRDFDTHLGAKQLIDELGRFAPEATIGFTSEHRAQFGHSPELLRRRQ